MHVEPSNPLAAGLVYSQERREAVDYGGRGTHPATMARGPMTIIDEIERVRARNNANWMDLLRLAYRHAPDEATTIIRQIYTEDAAIGALVKDLVGSRV